MKHITLALLLALILLAVVACQPGGLGGSSDATGSGIPSNATHAPTPMEQWVPQVQAIDGTCDASIYFSTQVGEFKIRALAAAGHEAGAGGARVAIQSAFGSYVCSFERGMQHGCEAGPPVVVVVPTPPAVDVDPEEDASSADTSTDTEQ